MTNGDIMRLYDKAINFGGSTDFVIIHAVRMAIAKTRKECADIVLNRHVAMNVDERLALSKMILELPNKLNNMEVKP